jgi:hypothetical protein
MGSNRRKAEVTPHKRHEQDFYETPPWVTEAILPHLPAALSAFDPCAGRGAIMRVLRASKHRFVTTKGLEIDQARVDYCRSEAGGWLTVWQADSLTCDWERPHLIVMNPPFSLAQEFVEAAIVRVAMGGTVAALLRLGFLASKRRVALHRKHPADVYVLPRRPSFTGGGTDSSEYAWLLWGPGRGGRWSVLDLPEPSATVDG